MGIDIALLFCVLPQPILDENYENRMKGYVQKSLILPKNVSIHSGKYLKMFAGILSG